MRRREGESPPLVYRTTSTFLFGVAGLLIAAWFVIDSLRALDRPGGRVGAAVTLVAAVLIFAAAVRPAVIADDDGVLIRNPFRNIRVPWPRITEFGVRYSLDVHTAERTYPTWAVSRSTWRRQSSLVPGSGGHEHRAPSFAEQAVDELTLRLRGYRQSAAAARGEGAGDEVRVTWSRPMLGALAAAVVLLVLAAVIR